MNCAMPCAPARRHGAGIEARLDLQLRRQQARRHALAPGGVGASARRTPPGSRDEQRGQRIALRLGRGRRRPTPAAPPPSSAGSTSRRGRSRTTTRVRPPGSNPMTRPPPALAARSAASAGAPRIERRRRRRQRGGVGDPLGVRALDGEAGAFRDQQRERPAERDRDQHRDGGLAAHHAATCWRTSIAGTGPAGSTRTVEHAARRRPDAGRRASPRGSAARAAATGSAPPAAATSAAVGGVLGRHARAGGRDRLRDRQRERRRPAAPSRRARSPPGRATSSGLAGRRGSRPSPAVRRPRRAPGRRRPRRSGAPRRSVGRQRRPRRARRVAADERRAARPPAPRRPPRPRPRRRSGPGRRRAARRARAAAPPRSRSSPARARAPWAQHHLGRQTRRARRPSRHPRGSARKEQPAVVEFFDRSKQMMWTNRLRRRNAVVRPSSAPSSCVRNLIRASLPRRPPDVHLDLDRAGPADARARTRPAGRGGST